MLVGPAFYNAKHESSHRTIADRLLRLGIGLSDADAGKPARSLDRLARGHAASSFSTGDETQFRQELKKTIYMPEAYGIYQKGGTVGIR